MLKNTNESKSVLSDLILNLAYQHPEAKHCMFVAYGALTVCPQCACEFCFIVFEKQRRKTLICQHCGLLFIEREVNAA